MAEEEKLKTQLKNITSSLQKIVECPVCLDTIKVPFTTCSRGHIICNSCCGNLQKCPTCQALFTSENPTCLKNLLEALPRLCRYSDESCKEIVEQGNDHEVFCEYRPVACRQFYCKVKVPLIKLMDHYKTYHPERSVCTVNSVPIKWPKFDPKLPCITHIPVLLFKNIFWFSAANYVKEKHLKCSFQATPNGKLENNYFAQVKFENEDFLYASTIKASISRSSELQEVNNGEDKDNGQVGGEEEYYMKIPQSALHRFIDIEGKLKFTVFFFEESM